MRTNDLADFEAIANLVELAIVERHQICSFRCPSSPIQLLSHVRKYQRDANEESDAREGDKIRLVFGNAGEQVQEPRAPQVSRQDCAPRRALSIYVPFDMRSKMARTLCVECVLDPSAIRHLSCVSTQRL